MLHVYTLRHRLLGLAWCMLLFVAHTTAIGEVIWAVNCGGESHTDIHGIRYQRDMLSTGISSDYGKSLMIQRVVPQDQILYQTERYHTATFGYTVPIKDDGDYVLVLKFSEVWFTAPNQKVFHVQLNDILAVENLDIFAKVGRGSAHDEVIPFTVKNGILRFGGETSPIEDRRISVEFLKDERDNPKINAFYVMKGSVDEVPQLPPMPGFDKNNREQAPDMMDEEDDEIDEDIKKPAKRRNPSGPKVQDPYAADETGSMMLPVVLAVGAFVPIVFCLCKL